MRARAEALGGRLVEDPALLDKLAAICEIPGVMEGRFGDAFLELPAEVLATSLRDHQSALTVAAPNGDGTLLPYFLTVMDRPDDPDRPRPLRQRVGGGGAPRRRPLLLWRGPQAAARPSAPSSSSASPSTRSWGATPPRPSASSPSSAAICDQLGWGAEKPQAVDAARLLKVDLTTEMVKEFTSLQGIMGGIYAREEGQPEEVWQAIYDQYLPASAEDRIPRGRVGQVVGLADRIDTLVGIFGLGLIPTGTKDPFGLRRAAQGVVRIALEGGLPLDLEAVAAEAASLYGDRLTRSAGADPGRPPPLPRRPHPLPPRPRRLRLRRDRGRARRGSLQPAGPRAPGWTPSTRCARRPAFLSVVLAAKRIANIVKDAAEAPLDEALLVEPAERDLADAFAGLRADIEDGRRGRRLRALPAPHRRPRRRCSTASSSRCMVMAEDPAVRPTASPSSRRSAAPSRAPPGSPRWWWTRRRRGRRRGRRPFSERDRYFLNPGPPGLLDLLALLPGLVPRDLTLAYGFVDGDSYDWITNGLRLAGADVRYSGRSPRPLWPSPCSTACRRCGCCRSCSRACS